MRILIDGDATPDIEKIAFLCDKYDIKMIVYCDMNHFFDYESVVICDQGNDSVDYAILRDVKKGDLVITQDYGEAGMLLAKGAIVVHPSGFMIDSNNIDSLLMTRYINGKMRKHQHVKGPKKRTQETRKRFLETIEGIISNEI